MVSTVSTTSSLVTTAQNVSAITASTVAELLRAAEHPLPSPVPSGPSRQRVLLEYVSANPNGPVTGVHGRGGAVGDALSSLLKASGTDLTREFYVNDATASRQMHQFARAILHRYRQLFGQETWNGAALPRDAEGYPEEYITRTAQRLIDRFGDRFTGQEDDVALQALQDATAQWIHQEQEETLAALNIHFDHWFFESELYAAGAVEKTLARLRQSGHTYEQGSALWLRSTTFGDEADRVLRRADGSFTYLAGDLAYHAAKFDRGYDRLIDIWAADHAGYIERTRAGLTALGYDGDGLTVLLVGPVQFIQDGAEMKANGTDGFLETVTLSEMLNELSPHALRWALVSAPLVETLTIDSDRLRRQNGSNPLWAIGYALSTSRRFANDGGDVIAEGIVERLLAFPQRVATAQTALSPSGIADYLSEIASEWNALIASGVRPDALLARAMAATLDRGLNLLGIDLKDEIA